MSLPPTYYEFLQRVRPAVVTFAEQDAAELAGQAEPPEVIKSIDDYPSRFSACCDALIEEVLENAATQQGVDKETLRPHIEMARKHDPMLGQMLLSANYEYHAYLNFALSGKKTFYVSDNLSEHLANTEVNMRAELIQVPYPSFQMVFTSPAAIDALHNLQGREGRRAMHFRELDYSAPVTAELTMLPGTADLPGRSLMILAWHARPPSKGYMMAKRQIYLPDDWTLEQSLRTEWDKIGRTAPHGGYSLDDELNVEPYTDDSLFYTDGLLFFRMVMNTLLYLSSEEAELTPRRAQRQALEEKAAAATSGRKKRLYRKEASRHTALDYSEIGASVSPIVIERGAASGDGKRASGSAPTTRFMVRGHWRNQAHGAGRADRKLIWIRPYMKGPDVAEVVNKPYLVR
ncbi:hypothetical protein J2T57_001614 [Natronocella acetinitrilica]|uniref:Uncharacterized protein n=1 Tax=Natronocella acetinitrilica TaxID=414046 RepID=A0AAE3KFV9_9GAMM|nr:hypothetical protein [Natronocella acetinitrilica]MCP1674512.1 hypothetical protein [Natronocella acetinitrilica]